MTERRYRAFISYSHRDDKWASWLHKTLEAYRPPKNLIGQKGERGEIPPRLSPVFRDRDELPSATNLGAVIDQALSQSECQIVICSPAAAQSRWVNEEIKAYKRLGREDRILCLIVDGEPYASADPKRMDDECFPEALRFRMGADGELSDEPTEPIAADARDGKDGKTNAKLKLIAGMLGVGFDALKQREHHRRQRRLMAVATAAAIGMVITTALATAALFARAEADRQRLRAEEEAEIARQTTSFMVQLFEVSDPSEARGNTITAREILDRGAERIESELADEPTIQATLMDTLGSVFMSLVLYEQAKPLLEAALERRWSTIGREHPDSASTEAQLGALLTDLADYESAEEHLLNALEIQRRSLDANDPEIAETLIRLADLESTLGRFGVAEQRLREALDIRVNAYGEEHADVASTLESLGLALQDQDDLDSARPLLERALAMQRRLWENRPHPALADAINNLAFVLYDEGDYQRVEELYAEALEMNRQLYDANHTEIAVALNNLAMVRHDQGQLDDAEAMYREALAIRAEAHGTLNPEYAIQLNNLAFLLYDQGNVASALDALSETLQIYRELFPDGSTGLADSLSIYGGWQLELGNVTAARRAIMECLAMRQSLLGDTHRDVGASLVQLAMISVAGGQFEAAIDAADRASAILDESLSPEHWRSALARIAKGGGLTGLSRLQEAESLLVEAYSVMESDGGAPRIYLRTALSYLRDLYTALDSPESAARYAALLNDH